MHHKDKAKVRQMVRWFDWLLNIKPTKLEDAGIGSKRRLYTRLCNKCDNILTKSGVRDICVRCSTMKPFRDGWGYKGCCAGCKYITPDGCSTKALFCKLWFCSDELYQKINECGLKEGWDRIIKVACDSGLYNKDDVTYHRKGIKDYPELN